jgi:prepilin-type N-terminal cleavage/methylation domain-containing protein
MRYASDKSRAFTLIEILIVVVILGIAAAVVIPQISSRDDLKAAAAARSVMADLVYAQNRAISTQKMVFVEFDATNQRYQLFSSLSPKVSLTHPLNKTDYLIAFGTSGTNGLEDAKLVGANFDGQKVIGFDEMGSPYSVDAATGTPTAMSTGTVDVKAGNGKTLRVSVEAYTAELTVATLP